MSAYTVQKISATLRKAGLTSAKWNSSGMVRGWGSWSSGYKTRKGFADEVIVDYRYGHHNKWAQDKANRETDMAKVRAALDAAAIPYTYDDHREQVTIGGAP